jgi:hypothetical protein
MPARYRLIAKSPNVGWVFISIPKDEARMVTDGEAEFEHTKIDAPISASPG